ncbi:hypothetical protein DERF_004800 [Dermatophagoides farinae]|uniref:Uncharacterized protein n=1 Tax=Dermatophagoides farinae TaxID=6954 RepID=A0A922L831_DERFA|nr:hypothetical protein DERF_004800 [Dermatophagoides farinae]
MYEIQLAQCLECQFAFAIVGGGDLPPSVNFFGMIGGGNDGDNPMGKGENFNSKKGQKKGVGSHHHYHSYQPSENQHRTISNFGSFPKRNF